MRIVEIRLEQEAAMTETDTWGKKYKSYYGCFTGCTYFAQTFVNKTMQEEYLDTDCLNDCVMVL